MKTAFAFLAACLLFLALIFGCASQQGGGATIKEKTRQPSRQQDTGFGQGYSPGPGLNATDGENESGGLADEPQDQFAGIIPRNISDKISDGQFKLEDQAYSPLKISVIDAGNADAVLIRKGEFTVLVDAGDFEKADAYLRANEIGRLDVLVATRDAPDAIEGMERVLGSYQVGEFWENGVPAVSGEYKAVVRKIGEKGIPIKRPEAGDSLDVFGVKFEVLNPQKLRLKGSAESDAIVLKISSGDFCMLLLNPTVTEIESSLMNSGADVSCPVVSYFMHGEGRPTPSILVDRANPKDVVISVGANDRSLPSETTITRLEIAGKNVWRTDLQGTVEITKENDGEYRTSSKK
jgi:competence protein ComEC